MNEAPSPQNLPTQGHSPVPPPSSPTQPVGASEAPADQAAPAQPAVSLNDAPAQPSIAPAKPAAVKSKVVAPSLLDKPSAPVKEGSPKPSPEQTPEAAPEPVVTSAPVADSAGEEKKSETSLGSVIVLFTLLSLIAGVLAFTWGARQPGSQGVEDKEASILRAQIAQYNTALGSSSSLSLDQSVEVIQSLKAQLAERELEIDKLKVQNDSLTTELLLLKRSTK